MTSVLVPVGATVKVAPPVVPGLQAAVPQGANLLYTPVPGIQGRTGNPGEGASIALVGAHLIGGLDFRAHAQHRGGAHGVKQHALLKGSAHPVVDRLVHEIARLVF